MKVMDPMGMGYAVRQLPLVSPDGRHVAIDLGYGHAYAWYGVGGKLEDKIVLIDEATADGAPGHEPDPTKLAALAARVKDKLAGYVPFPTHPEATLGTTQLGATKLELAADPNAGMDRNLRRSPAACTTAAAIPSPAACVPQTDRPPEWRRPDRAVVELARTRSKTRECSRSGAHGPAFATEVGHDPRRRHAPSPSVRPSSWPPSRCASSNALAVLQWPSPDRALHVTTEYEQGVVHTHVTGNDVDVTDLPLADLIGVRS